MALNKTSKFIFESSPYSFGRITLFPCTEGALYVQPSVQGNSVILPNEYGEESKMNLEVLFNAMLAERVRMQQMFNR